MRLGARKIMHPFYLAVSLNGKQMGACNTMPLFNEVFAFFALPSFSFFIMAPNGPGTRIILKLTELNK